MHQTLLFLPAHIHHPYILPILGVLSSSSFPPNQGLGLGTEIRNDPEDHTDPEREIAVPALVVPWCESGNLSEYLKGVVIIERERERSTEVGGWVNRMRWVCSFHFISSSHFLISFRFLISKFDSRDHK